MKEKKVVSRENLPTNLPIRFTILIWLLLDRLQVSQLVWGVGLSLIFLVWVGAIVNLTRAKQFDIFARR